MSGRRRPSPQDTEPRAPQQQMDSSEFFGSMMAAAANSLSSIMATDTTGREEAIGWTLIIQKLAGEAKELKVLSSSTFEELKALVRQSEALSEDLALSLLLEEKLLEESSGKALADYGIDDGATLTVVVHVSYRKLVLESGRLVLESGPEQGLEVLPPFHTNLDTFTRRHHVTLTDAACADEFSINADSGEINPRGNGTRGGLKRVRMKTSLRLDRGDVDLKEGARPFFSTHPHSHQTSWMLNADMTISPKGAPGLVLGWDSERKNDEKMVIARAQLWRQ